MIAIYVLAYGFMAFFTTLAWLVAVQPEREGDGAVCLLMGVFWPIGISIGLAVGVVGLIGMAAECLYRKGWLSSPFKRRKH